MLMFSAASPQPAKGLTSSFLLNMADTGHDECGTGAVTVSDYLSFFFSPKERNLFVFYLLLAKASKQTDKTATMERWGPRPAGAQQLLAKSFRKSPEAPGVGVLFQHFLET